MCVCLSISTSSYVQYNFYTLGNFFQDSTTNYVAMYTIYCTHAYADIISWLL